MFRAPFLRTCWPASVGVGPLGRVDAAILQEFPSAEEAEATPCPEGYVVESIVDAEGITIYPAPTA